MSCEIARQNIRNACSVGVTLRTVADCEVIPLDFSLYRILYFLLWTQCPCPLGGWIWFPFSFVFVPLFFSAETRGFRASECAYLTAAVQFSGSFVFPSYLCSLFPGVAEKVRRTDAVRTARGCVFSSLTLP